MKHRPLIVFDVNETLLDLESLRPTFDRIFGDPCALRLWFAALITYSEALTLADVFVPFTDIGAAVLRMLATPPGTFPGSEALAASLLVRLHLLHEQFGIPRLDFGLLGAGKHRPRKVG